MKATIIATNESLGPADRYVALQWSRDGATIKQVLYHGSDLDKARKSIGLLLLKEPDAGCTVVETLNVYWGYSGAIEVPRAELELAREQAVSTVPGYSTGEGAYEERLEIDIPACNCPRIARQLAKYQTKASTIDGGTNVEIKSEE